MLSHPDRAYVEQARDLLDTDRYAGCLGPFGEALTLPALAYTSETFQALENEKIWTRDWICVGTAAEIAGAYDLLPYTMGDHAIHVQRLPEGGLVARFNKAQHGGCRSVPAQCRTGRKTHCSYGSCGHSRDRGVIPGGPQGEMAPELAQYLGRMPERLLPAKLNSAGPFLFAHIDPTAGAQPAPQAPAWDEPAVRTGGSWRELRANWKLAAGALVDAAAEKLSLKAEWWFPNLVVLRAGAVARAVIVQPAAMERTIWRVSHFDVGEVSDSLRARAQDDLDAVLERAAMAAERRQSDAERAGVGQTREASLSAWSFNQKLIQRLGEDHLVYWNAPLFRA